MHRKINRLFNALECSKLEMLSFTKQYSEEQVSFKPGTEEWSMVQVVKHLVMTETQILQHIQKRLAKGGLRPANIKSWVRYVVVKLALRYRKKIKTPRQVAMPPEGLNFTEVAEEWNLLRLHWKKNLEHLPPDSIDKNMFRHPIAGDMSIGHTLSFMNEHIRHHMAQLTRIRKAKNWQQ